MPLIQEWSPIPNSLAAIWNIGEPESFFEAETGLDATHIRHPERRIEYLAGRFLLRQLRGDFPLHLIEKDSQGKPQVPGTKLFFSISHSYPYVMALISESQVVGVDIQTPHEHIDRLATKFLTPEEQALLQYQAELYLLAWTAKEATYKLQGYRGVDFKTHLIIQKFGQENSLCQTEIRCSLMSDTPTASIISLKNNLYTHSIAFFKTN